MAPRFLPGVLSQNLKAAEDQQQRNFTQLANVAINILHSSQSEIYNTNWCVTGSMVRNSVHFLDGNILLNYVAQLYIHISKLSSCSGIILQGFLLRLWVLNDPSLKGDVFMDEQKKILQMTFTYTLLQRTNRDEKIWTASDYLFGFIIDRHNYSK